MLFLSGRGVEAPHASRLPSDVASLLDFAGIDEPSQVADIDLPLLRAWLAGYARGCCPIKSGPQGQRCQGVHLVGNRAGADRGADPGLRLGVPAVDGICPKC